MKEDKYQYQRIARDLAEDHVEWFLKIIKPLLIEHMIHGFKHGVECESGIKNPAQE